MDKRCPRVVLADVQSTKKTHTNVLQCCKAPFDEGRVRLALRQKTSNGAGRFLRVTLCAMWSQASRPGDRIDRDFLHSGSRKLADPSLPDPQKKATCSVTWSTTGGRLTCGSLGPGISRYLTASGRPSPALSPRTPRPSLRLSKGDTTAPNSIAPHHFMFLE